MAPDCCLHILAHLTWQPWGWLLLPIFLAMWFFVPLAGILAFTSGHVVQVVQLSAIAAVMIVTIVLVVRMKKPLFYKLALLAAVYASTTCTTNIIVLALARLT